MRGIRSALHVVVMLWLGIACGSVNSAVAVDRAHEAVQQSQAAIGGNLPDIALTDTAGRRVRLADFRGKPLLVTMMYTGCADVCPTLIENLVPAVKVARDALGADSFAVVTIGFDIRQDSPEHLKSFAKARGADLSNWSFLAADEASLDRLARAVGFAFYSRPGGFDHLSQVSFVDAEGRLYQQVYGAVFDPPLIVEPLKNLVFKRDTPLASMERLIDRVKYFCTIYDPASGRYYFNYSLFMSIAIGLGCFGLVLIFIIREWQKSHTKMTGAS